VSRDASRHLETRSEMWIASVCRCKWDRLDRKGQCKYRVFVLDAERAAAA
jgi:hypothetical protein